MSWLFPSKTKKDIQLFRFSFSSSFDFRIRWCFVGISISKHCGPNTIISGLFFHQLKENCLMVHPFPGQKNAKSMDCLFRALRKSFCTNHPPATTYKKDVFRSEGRVSFHAFWELLYRNHNIILFCIKLEIPISFQLPVVAQTLYSYTVGL